ncbi:MAG: nucleoside phosphorylase [Thermodesulfobacteriota bacterium]
MNRQNEDDPVVRPVVSKRAPKGGPVAVMTATEGDLSTLCPLLGMDRKPPFPLFMSRLFGRTDMGKGVFLVGPMVGAPYAVMILESLAAMGVRRILFYGWCGAVSPELAIGDIILPSGAIIDEGTSTHYIKHISGEETRSIIPSARPSGSMNRRLKESLTRNGLAFHEGMIWTTDAIFRETSEKVIRHQKNGVLAVEMELSALFTAGSFYGLDVSGLLVVSDEISSLRWIPGFKDDRFKSSRNRICEVISHLCRIL